MSADASSSHAAALAARSRHRRRQAAGSLGKQLILIVVCLIVVTPCIFLVLGSFKSVSEFFASPFGLPKSWSLTNYRNAWKEADLAHAFFNSVLVTSLSVLLSTAIGSLASYAIARLRFRGATLLQMLFVVGLILPLQLIVIAVFVEMRWLGLVNTIFPLIILYAASATPLTVLFLVGFFRAIPAEFFDAAAIDGASVWRQFAEMALPLARAPIFTVAIINSVWIWNDFFLPLVFSTKQSLQTVPVAVLNFYGEYTTEYGLIFAGVVMSALPVLLVYMVMTKQFIRAAMAGGIKG